MTKIEKKKPSMQINSSVRVRPQFLEEKYQENKALALGNPTLNILGNPVTALSFNAQIEKILEWARSYQSKVVCVANVHMLMEAHWNAEFSSVLHNADIVTPDGMPLVWMMKLMGIREQNRVAGMDILLALCKSAPAQNVSVFFLGSETTILQKMRSKLEREFPNLRIADMVSLPFRPLTAAEDEAIVQRINQSQAKLVLVSLGCPKQEYWMHNHKGKIQAVMIGLGGVFPVLAGVHKRAPLWIQNLGLEWLYRLVQEPRRLWKRYTYTIPPFIWLCVKQLLSSKYNSISMLKIVEKS